MGGDHPRRVLSSQSRHPSVDFFFFFCKKEEKHVFRLCFLFLLWLFLASPFLHSLSVLETCASGGLPYRLDLVRVGAASP